MIDNIDFNKIKQTVIPYFIEVYGEEYKDIIIERLNKIQPIFYNTIDNKKEEMYRLEKSKKIELTLKFLEYNSILIPEDIKNEMIKNNNTYCLNKIPEAKEILEACFGTCEYNDITFNGINSIIQEPVEFEYDKRKSVDALKKFGVQIEVNNYNEWLSTEEAKDIFKKINRLKDFIHTLDLEYKEFDSRFIGLKLSIDKSNAIANELEEKYILEFIKSIQQYLSLSDKKLFEEYMNSDRKNFYAFKSNMDILKLCGDSFFQEGIIQSFSSSSYEKLNNPNTSNFVKQTIIENRIKYYQMIGSYNNELSYDEFLLTDEATIKAFSKELADKILLEKEKYKQKKEEEYTILTSNYKECLSKIESLNLATNHSFNVDIVKEGIRCINPSTRVIDGIPELVPLLFFSKERCLPEYIDVMFIHELNHVIETILIDYKNDESIYKTGYETLTDDDTEVRDYEAFSEIQNQLIAIDVTEAMHRDNIYLFDNPKTSKTRGSTSYEHQRFFVDEFYQNFKKEIMKARVSNNLESLFNVVGKDNFERLNSIINEYVEIPYYKMMDDVISGKTTELTEKRQKLMSESIDVLNQMINYSNQISNYEETQKMTM